MIKLSVFIIMLLFIFPKISSAQEDKLSLLDEIFSGEYSTSEQAQVDSEIIDLHLEITPFSMENQPGKWFYLETAFTGSIDSPYKQEVYNFQTASIDFIYLERYTIKNGKKYIHALKDKNVLKTLSVEQLQKKENCTILISIKKNTFIGITAGKGCISKVRNAQYSTTDIEITKEDFFLWEQGFDGKNKQVWGPKMNGYVFKKINTKK